MWIRDDVPQEFEAAPDEFVRRLSAHSRVTVHYDLTPSRRGSFALTAVHVRVRSRLGLWQRFLVLPCRSQLFVYPDMRQLSEYAILARTNRLSLMGVRRTRKVGLDHDFERLRDYSQDDNYKHIDWRATARRRRLTVKDFQTSQSQRIVFLLDCGRMMTNQSAGLSLLDHALNAMLMLAYVALRGALLLQNLLHIAQPRPVRRRIAPRCRHAPALRAGASFPTAAPLAPDRALARPVLRAQVVHGRGQRLHHPRIPEPQGGL